MAIVVGFVTARGTGASQCRTVEARGIASSVVVTVAAGMVTVRVRGGGRVQLRLKGWEEAVQLVEVLMAVEVEPGRCCHRHPTAKGSLILPLP